MSFKEKLVKELKTENLTNFVYNSPQDFYISQWQQNDTVSYKYLVYRFFVLTFHLTIATIYVNITLQIPMYVKLRQTAYLTNWTFNLCIITSLIGLIVTAKAYVRERYEEKLLFITYWVLHNLTVDTCVAVGVLYYSCVFFLTTKLHYWGLVYHFLFTTITVVDLFMVRMEVRLLHGWITLIFGTVYAVFQPIYYYCGGKGIWGQDNLYPVIDWKHQVLRSIAISLIGIVFLVFCRMSQFLMYLLRISLYNKNVVK